MPQTSRQRLGQWGESMAARYLEQHGYTILGRNIRTPYGEIDLVARRVGGELVFIEVKTRTGTSFGAPEEAVDRRKLAHLVSSSQAYFVRYPDQQETSWRIDVIAVIGHPGQDDPDIQFEHFENVAS